MFLQFITIVHRGCPDAIEFTRPALALDAQTPRDWL